MNVIWTRSADCELRGIYNYIAQTSSRHAQGVVDRITRKTKILSSVPLMGAEVPEYGDSSIRELFDHPYRIIYRVEADRILVASIVHSARQLPKSLPD